MRLEDEFDPSPESELDRDFPLGDGTAETDATANCPYCNEAVTIVLDPGGGAAQEYVEDCRYAVSPVTSSCAMRRTEQPVFG